VPTITTGEALSGTTRAAGASQIATVAAGTAAAPVREAPSAGALLLLSTLPPSCARMEAGREAGGNIASQQSGTRTRAYSEREQRRAVTSAGGSERGAIG